ncbi:MAG: SEL1-like repeat protein, partial [Asticcacaulis sp.]|nr:SEL1-like repeat protein [Asticcacaulis sp.]
MFKTCISLIALACAILPLAAQAQSEAADEARRQSMMNEMRTNDYNNDQRNNTPASSSYHSTTNSGSGTGTHDTSEPATFAKPYEYVPEGPHSVVATYEFKVFVQETEAQTIARITGEAKAGNAQSQFNLGRIFYTGYGVKQDDGEARHWFCEAAKQDHPIAKSQCAAMMYNGQGGPEDKALAMAYAKESAEKGDPYGEALYGFWTYQDGVRAGNTTADARTIAYLVDAADHGEVVAQSLLGSTIFYFSGPTQDMPRAIRYLRMCDAKGLPMCSGALGAVLYYGYGGTAVDMDAGLAKLVRAADAGHAESCGVLANIYNDQSGGHYDEVKALKYARMGAAAAKPDAAAELVLGLYTYLGVQVPKDMEEGRRIIRLAAEHGNPQGQFFVGLFYYNGEGTDKDDVEAV